ncbi:hypothetical protein TBLA_0C03630 [Henningerozyma blattae CBS 6284]|uniref:Adenylate cyclase n=1 Tax=Henningerozyma blattae (strain ATCC 34711 / CBS 6284 / DSM 70876 / NBRC 10599 / NRRL Y-10934 / UCD 77-7) TaxID=1071380 RepID=I2H1B4_HENB6|nr:hypothetical protein TBLA_0C03630 [Tetrapisispora blattae CBS 6284]CCH60166.1 hypothetical protein TBLA_0C03630 [Tetrapisispora blattae CBS 6284]
MNINSDTCTTQQKDGKTKRRRSLQLNRTMSALSMTSFTALSSSNNHNINNSNVTSNASSFSRPHSGKPNRSLISSSSTPRVLRTMSNSLQEVSSNLSTKRQPTQLQSSATASNADIDPPTTKSNQKKKQKNEKVTRKQSFAGRMLRKLSSNTSSPSQSDAHSHQQHAHTRPHTHHQFKTNTPSNSSIYSGKSKLNKKASIGTLNTTSNASNVTGSPGTTSKISRRSSTNSANVHDMENSTTTSLFRKVSNVLGHGSSINSKDNKDSTILSPNSNPFNSPSNSRRSSQVSNVATNNICTIDANTNASSRLQNQVLFNVNEDIPTKDNNDNHIKGNNTKATTATTTTSNNNVPIGEKEVTSGGKPKKNKILKNLKKDNTDNGNITLVLNNNKKIENVEEDEEDKTESERSSSFPPLVNPNAFKLDTNLEDVSDITNINKTGSIPHDLMNTNTKSSKSIGTDTLLLSQKRSRSLADVVTYSNNQDNLSFLSNMDSMRELDINGDPEESFIDEEDDDDFKNEDYDSEAESIKDNDSDMNIELESQNPKKQSRKISGKNFKEEKNNESFSDLSTSDSSDNSDPNLDRKQRVSKISKLHSSKKPKQWVAPESWDVELTALENTRQRRSNSNRSRSNSANSNRHRRRHHHHHHHHHYQDTSEAKIANNANLASNNNDKEDPSIPTSSTNIKNNESIIANKLNTNLNQGKASMLNSYNDTTSISPTDKSEIIQSNNSKVLSHLHNRLLMTPSTINTSQNSNHIVYDNDQQGNTVLASSKKSTSLNSSTDNNNTVFYYNDEDESYSPTTTSETSSGSLSDSSSTWSNEYRHHSRGKTVDSNGNHLNNEELNDATEYFTTSHSSYRDIRGGTDMAYGFDEDVVDTSHYTPSVAKPADGGSIGGGSLGAHSSVGSGSYSRQKHDNSNTTDDDDKDIYSMDRHSFGNYVIRDKIRSSSGSKSTSAVDNFDEDCLNPAHPHNSLNFFFSKSKNVSSHSLHKPTMSSSDQSKYSNILKTDSENTVIFTKDDEQHDQAEYELEKYYKDFSDLDPKRNYAIRIFNTDDTFTTLSCTPGTTVQDMIPTLRKKFNTTQQGTFQISLKVGKLSKILKPQSKPIIIERKLLLLNGYKKTDPLHIMGIEDLSFVFKFLFHPVAPSHLTAQQEQKLLRGDFIHVDLRSMGLTTPPIIFYQHTSEIESLDVSNNANIFLPSEFIESGINLSSLRMVNIRASRFPTNVTDAYKLISLELQRNFIKKVPNSISKLTNLTILNMQCNSLSKLPKGFAKLKNLQLLDLSSNNFVEYPIVINHCSSLLQFDLSYNKIQYLPPNINLLNKIAKINLSHNKLLEITDLSSLKNLRTLNLRHNRITTVKTSAINLQNLFLTDNRISTFDDALPKLRALELQENPITSITYKDFFPINMTNLSLKKAKLSSIPGELFLKLHRLQKLELSENNLTQLPKEISCLNKLVYLSVARNKLEGLPTEFSKLKNLKSLDLHSNNIRNFILGTEDIELTYLNISSNAFGEFALDGTFFQTITNQSRMAKSLLFFIAADNQFDDRIWPLFNCFENLNVLNLSYNNFTDISNLKIQNLTELFFSGNKLTTLPGDTVLRWLSLKVLMLNGNHLLSLPAELSKLCQLTVFDIGSNQLKYNISNYHYDWNWRDNKELRYLNFSANRRFEIRSTASRDINADLSDFSVLPNLKVLGLMDVTLNTSKVPDEGYNFRLRTTGSVINGMMYGVADSLGQRNYVSSRDVTFERFRGKEDECLLCLHDGKNQTSDIGHNISRIVRDIYDKILRRQLEKYGEDDEGVKKALRFSFLQLNKEINIMLYSVDNGTRVENLTSADLLSGACSTIIYIKGNKLFTANIGDCMAILSKNNGDYEKLTTLHVPYKTEEYERIRISGGYVNNDKLDGSVDVSRAVGFFDLLPHIHASPDISMVTLTKSDQMLVIATHKLWEYVNYETACDIAREKSSDPMLAAEELKDHAIAYGCSDNITILCLALNKSANQQNRFVVNKNSLMTRRTTFEDATLRRLQAEIAPPTGNLAVVFTDIKNSTVLWELFPNAMRTAIKTHNDIMRRQLRIFGGYEVKTEGDAFMVTFPTPISGLVWCLNVQLKLLDAQWPEEITSIQDGCLITDKNGVKIYQGLSVRMGIHWGCPVPELDLVTQRMDYLGPVVNKAARVSGIADGGQISMSSDYVSEFKKIVGYHERITKNKERLNEVYGEEIIGEVLEKEVTMLESIGWVFFEHGEQKLKGLETKEFITIAYPKTLASRHEYTSDVEEGDVNTDALFRLRSASNKLQVILSAVSGDYLELDTYSQGLHGFIDLTENSQDTILKDLNEKELMAFLEHLVSRIESTVAILQLRQRISSGLNIYASSERVSSTQTSIFEIVDMLLENLGK